MRLVSTRAQDAERGAIDALVVALEAHTPVKAPTAALEALSGDWRLLYTTARDAAAHGDALKRSPSLSSRSPPPPPRPQVTIRGSKRTKLGLRGLVSLGAFTQRIDAAAGRASNVVGFALSGGGAFRGALTVDAAFTVASPKRCAHACAGREARLTLHTPHRAQRCHRL